MTTCCSQQQIIETEEEVLCGNCGTVHGLPTNVTEQRYWEEERYSKDQVKRRLTKFDPRTARLNFWMTRGRMNPQLSKIIELLLQKLEIPATKSAIITQDAISMYIKLISNKQGYWNRNSVVYFGAIIYHLLKVYGMKRSYQEFLRVIDDVMQIYESKTKVKTGKMMYRVLAYIRETYPDSHGSTNTNLESLKSLINKEILKIGTNQGIDHTKLISIINLVLNIPEKYLTGRSPSVVASALIANELNINGTHPTQIYLRKVLAKL